MASAEHEPIRLTGVWGQIPQRGPGGAPGQGARPPEAESILVIGCPTERAGKFGPFPKMSFRTSLHATKSLTTAESSMQSKGLYERAES